MENTTENYGVDLNSSTTPPVYPKSSAGLVIKIVIGAVVVGLIGTGIILDAKIWDPSWNPFRENAEKNVEEMIDKMMEVKTMHYDMEIGIEAIDESLDEDSYKLTLAFKGDSDSTDIENPKSSSDFSIVMATEGMEFNLAGQGKTLSANESYFKLDTIPMIPGLDSMLMMFGINIDEIKGKWIKLEQDDSNEMYDIDKLTKLSEGFEERIKEIIAQEKFYYVKETLNSERIGGQNMYHYVLSPNKEAIEKIVFEYIEMMVGFDQEMMSTEERQEFEEGMDEFLEKSGDIDIEVWIGKRDNLLYRVKCEKEIDAKMMDEDAQGKLIIKFDMNLSDFGKPVTIEAPTDFIESKDLFQMPSYDDYYPLDNDYPPYYPE